MKTKAVAYLRVSGKGQVDGDGFPRQSETASKYAERNGLEIVDEYKDEGISGTSELAGRPGLAALLDRIESNGVRIVLVESATRLARDLFVQEVLLNEFRKLGVTVVECDGGNDLTDNDNPTAKMTRQILGAVAEFEKEVTVLKLRASRERIRRSGERCEGRKPYGFHPNEKPVVALMMKLFRKPRKDKRLSFAKIAQVLNDLDLVSRTGKPWSATVVMRIIKKQQGIEIEPEYVKIADELLRKRNEKVHGVN